MNDLKEEKINTIFQRMRRNKHYWQWAWAIILGFVLLDEVLKIPNLHDFNYVALGIVIGSALRTLTIF